MSPRPTRSSFLSTEPVLTTELFWLKTIHTKKPKIKTVKNAHYIGTKRSHCQLNPTGNSAGQKNPPVFTQFWGYHCLEEGVHLAELRVQSRLLHTKLVHQSSELSAVFFHRARAPSTSENFCFQGPQHHQYQHQGCLVSGCQGSAQDLRSFMSSLQNIQGTTPKGRLFSPAPLPSAMNQGGLGVTAREL